MHESMDYAAAHELRYWIFRTCGCRSEDTRRATSDGSGNGVARMNTLRGKSRVALLCSDGNMPMHNGFD